MVGRFGGSSAGFVVAALNAASAASREVIIRRVLSAGILRLAVARREMFEANSERPWQRRPTGRIVPAFGHGDQTFAHEILVSDAASAKHKP
jgi:hypothetical protein